MIQILTLKDKEQLNKIRQRSTGEIENALQSAKEIIEQVKKQGDNALIELSRKFDGYSLTTETIEVSKKEIQDAYKKVDKKVITAMKSAIQNIKKFSQKQMPKEWKTEMTKGVIAGQLIRPIDSVGCYIPGGSYPLPSSVLMTVVPAKFAGVRKIIICTPPKKGNEVVIVAADLAGANNIFRIGGAQAIAAMAYGTEKIPRVDKIVGPGNIYVTAAKKILYGTVGFDFLAGPSEVLIYAEKGNPMFIAADMLAQAEHDKYACALFVTANKALAQQVQREIDNQLSSLSTRSIAEQSINTYGAILLVNNAQEAISFINDFAPEHLELFDERILGKISNAGAIFLGEESCEAAGDYAVGPSHVLPTGGIARYRSGLSVYDFIKMPSIQKLSKKGLHQLKKIISPLAEAEGLIAHKKSVDIR